jgi:hypothetical protein
MSNTTKRTTPTLNLTPLVRGCVSVDALPLVLAKYNLTSMGITLADLETAYEGVAAALAQRNRAKTGGPTLAQRLTACVLQGDKQGEAYSRALVDQYNLSKRGLSNPCPTCYDAVLIDVSILQEHLPASATRHGAYWAGGSNMGETFTTADTKGRSNPNYGWKYSVTLWPKTMVEALGCDRVASLTVFVPPIVPDLAVRQGDPAEGLVMVLETAIEVTGAAEALVAVASATGPRNYEAEFAAALVKTDAATGPSTTPDAIARVQAVTKAKAKAKRAAAKKAKAERALEQAQADNGVEGAQ